MSPSIAPHLIDQGSVSHLNPELMDPLSVVAWLSQETLDSAFLSPGITSRPPRPPGIWAFMWCWGS